MKDLQLEQIEAYLKNRLSAPERADFDQEMANNVGLQKLVEKMTMLQAIVARQHTRENIKNIHQKMMIEWDIQNNPIDSKTNNAVWPIIPLWRVAATAVAASVGFVVYLGLSPMNMPSTEFIAAERGLMTGLDPKGKQQVQTFTQAQTLLSLGEGQAALPLLKQIAEDASIRPNYRDKALWLMALASYSAGQSQKSKAIVEDFESKPRSFEPTLLEKWKLKTKTLF